MTKRIFNLKAVNILGATSLILLALTSPVRSADPDGPRVLEPRYDIENKAAPSRHRVRSPAPIAQLTAKQCASLYSAEQRQDCMMRASGGPWSFKPAVEINETAQANTVVIGN